MLNDSDVEDAALALADALGSDFIQLAPPDEGHFDSVEIAEYVAFALLGAVGGGITAGVKDWTKNATVNVLDSIAAQIRKVLPDLLRTPFSTVVTPETRATDERNVASELRSAAEATVTLPPATAGEVITVSAAAAQAALEDMGLHVRVSQRVHGELHRQLSIVLRIE